MIGKQVMFKKDITSAETGEVQYAKGLKGKIIGMLDGTIMETYKISLEDGRETGVPVFVFEQYLEVIAE